MNLKIQDIKESKDLRLNCLSRNVDTFEIRESEKKCFLVAKNN